MAWLSIASISSVRAGVGGEAGDALELAASRLGRRGHVGLQRGQRGLPLAQVGLGGEQPVVAVGQPLRVRR